MKAAAYAGLLLVIVALAGCAARPTGDAAIYGKAPEGSTMQEVRKRTGLPNAMRFLDTGEEVWEFNDRQVGWGAWRVVFEPDGKVREIKPIRRPEDVARLKTGGATGQEVLDLLGEPGGVSFAGQDAVWEYCLPDRSRLKVRFGGDKKVVNLDGA